MATLNAAQRRLLESVVIKARRVAEQGARKALQNMAVDQVEPFAHMDADQRSLRRRLRNKARLLGDEMTNGTQQITNLSYELAYEYWHKMLFARFLEANHLLIHPEHGVAVSLDECAEFAMEEGHTDKWTAASSYASQMLPAIFRLDDPLMQVEFATEDRIALEQLIDSIDEEIFLASDSLGWVYQFWQTEAKSAINASGDKIDGKRLPAVTQLFTEPYMVHFLIDNTIGAWWVSRHPNVKPPINFEYLRFLEDGTPAAGNFEGWPDTTAEITTLDPCMGSGHFIIELFQVMVPLRMFEEHISKEEATRRVIAQNLHGLEIDPRCTQIAAFNLALTAWKFCGHYLKLPEMNLACSGIAPRGRKEDWIKLVERIKDSVQRARMENGMAVLYEHFQLAPELGSLLDPSTIKPDAFTASFEELRPVLLKALANEEDKDLVERGVMAAGIAKAGEVLVRKFHLQITNVPYLARKHQGQILTNYCLTYYPDAKFDLANVFLARLIKKVNSHGSICVVIPQNWLFLSSYRKFRYEVLSNLSIKFIAQLGPGAFSQISGDVVKPILIGLSKDAIDKFSEIFGIDISNAPDVPAKSYNLKTLGIEKINQLDQLKNLDSTISLNAFTEDTRLKEYCESVQGIGTSDNGWFVRTFWELSSKDYGWEYLQTAAKESGFYRGLELIIWWEEGKGRFRQFVENLKAEGRNTGWNSGQNVWGKFGLSVAEMDKMHFTNFLGERYNNLAHAVIPLNSEILSALWCFFESGKFHLELRKFHKGLKVSNSVILNVPFKFEYWQKVADEKYPQGLPKPYSDNPTQWLFHGNPKIGDNPLLIAVARIFGYHWPAENDDKMELDEKARNYISQVKAFNYLSDDDGIVCIPPVNGEKPGAERLRDYIREVWGDDWGNNTISELLNKEGSSKNNLEQWLREEFFVQHCKVFQNRPFIWHIWDGRKDGFAALVNYHKLNKDRLKKLIYTYLNDWIRQCELKVKDSESGAEGLLMAAKQLKEKLELIMQGEPPYDIFVRWKPLHEQPIGWEPDLNDGVRLNIYPFMQAGVLRKNPNIKWEKDRGKNPPSSPWGPDRFNRYEDLTSEYKIKDKHDQVIEHLTNEVKGRARETNNKS